jgi:DNA-binding response OmpR family regulator
MHSVLIGESDADIRLALQLIFQRAGHQVTAVPHGAAVVRVTAAAVPDLLLLGLPEWQGLDTCRTLRADPRTAAIPIILLSAALYPDAAAATHAGADDYVTKPFDNSDLVTRARGLLPPHGIRAPGSDRFPVRAGRTG